MDDQLLPVADALKLLLAEFEPTPTEMVDIDQAYGRILGVDFVAPFGYPPFNNSAMDGFAVRAEDCKNASPDAGVRLPVVGDIPAGKLGEKPLEPGQAMRIMTGAPLPVGADAVIPVERTDFNQRKPGQAAPDFVEIYSPVSQGSYVRKAGQDLRKSERILETGLRLRAQEIGFLAMFGQSQVEVHQKPRIGLLSTGDELITSGQELHPGMIFESNSYTLSGLLEDAGGEVAYRAIAQDDVQVVRHHMDLCYERKVDLILSSAGVSVGAFDYVRSVVESQGSLKFWRVNMRPGKPLAFGHYRGIPFVGLPGNPVSAFVGFEVFVRPALARLSGRKNWSRTRVQVKLMEDISSDGRESYLRAVIQKENGELTARLTGHQDSGNLRSLVQANAFIIVPSEVKSLPIGTKVDAWLIGDTFG